MRYYFCTVHVAEGMILIQFLFQQTNVILLFEQYDVPWKMTSEIEKLTGCLFNPFLQIHELSEEKRRVYAAPYLFSYIPVFIRIFFLFTVLPHLWTALFYPLLIQCLRLTTRCNVLKTSKGRGFFYLLLLLLFASFEKENNYDPVNLLLRVRIHLMNAV